MSAAELRQRLREQRQQRPVDDDGPVFRVVDDVRDLPGGEPDVDRMQHRAHARHGVVRLQVSLVVPAEGADPVAGADPQRGQSGRQPFRVPGDLGVTDMRAAVTQPGHALAAPVHRGAVAQDGGDRELEVILHGAGDRRVGSQRMPPYSPCQSLRKVCTHSVPPAIGVAPAIR
jgi:hypothetical protein